MEYVRDEEFLKALGRRIRQLRNERKLTQEQLGNLIENHGKQIGRIERGEHNVSTSTVYRIAKGLSVSMKELFDFDI